MAADPRHPRWEDATGGEKLGAFVLFLLHMFWPIILVAVIALLVRWLS